MPSALSFSTAFAWSRRRIRRGRREARPQHRSGDSGRTKRCIVSPIAASKRRPLLTMVFPEPVS